MYQIFHPTSKKPFMLSEFTELFIHGITPERKTATKFLGVLINENDILKTQINLILPRLLKALVYFVGHS